MSEPTAAGADVVNTVEEAERLGREPLLILDPLGEYLASVGLGDGTPSATPIGSGHSNVTYLLQHAGRRVVLRRPPRGPLPVSTHDMLREARLLRALAGLGVRVPEVLAICESTDVIGAPFYLMAFIDGYVLDRRMPTALAADNSSAEKISDQLVDTLAELHSVDITDPELLSFGRPVGYLERQIKVFSKLLTRSERHLPELERVAAWLATNQPAHSDNSVVHGDYRLGNVMLAAHTPARIIAVLDWEMSTLGDPLADLGYLTATWAEAGDAPDPMLELSEVTRLPGFKGRDALAESYARRTGRDISALPWYQTLALFKAAIFLEGSYQRYLAGSTNDTYFAKLELGVPTIARRALTQAGIA